MICRAVGGCMLLQSVERVQAIASFPQGELDVRIDKRSDQLQIVRELSLRVEPSCASQQGGPRDSGGD